MTITIITAIPVIIIPKRNPNQLQNEFKPNRNEFNFLLIHALLIFLNRS